MWNIRRFVQWFSMYCCLIKDIIEFNNVIQYNMAEFKLTCFWTVRKLLLRTNNKEDIIFSITSSQNSPEQKLIQTPALKVIFH